MGLISVLCPSCGARAEWDDSREFGFCSYCGSLIMQDKLIVEHRGTISVDGIGTKQNYLDHAELFLEDGDFESALKNFNAALKLDAHCSKAYLGRLLALEGLRSAEELCRAPQRPLSAYPDFVKAKRFAQGREKQELERLERVVSALLREHERMLEQRLNAAEKKHAKSLAKLKGFGVDPQKLSSKKTLFKAFEWVGIVEFGVFLFFAIVLAIQGEIIGFAAILIVLVLPSFLLAFFMMKKVDGVELLRQRYGALKAVERDDMEELEAARSEYDEWLKTQDRGEEIELEE